VSEVEFPAKTARELLDDVWEIERTHAREQPHPQRDHGLQGRDVLADVRLEIGALDLDSPLASFVQGRRVHLGDGGRGHRGFAER
jgi:hypothetical protein